MRILIILGHPRHDGLCGALACVFGEGASAAGCEVETLCLGDLCFNPDVVEGSPAAQVLEPDLERTRSLIAWANHLMLVFPNLWGQCPPGSRASPTACSCRASPSASRTATIAACSDPLPAPRSDPVSPVENGATCAITHSWIAATMSY